MAGQGGGSSTEARSLAELGRLQFREATMARNCGAED